MLLGEHEAADWATALEQGKGIAAVLGNTVLVKGGHLPGPECPDALVNTTGLLSRDVVEVSGPRVATRNSHGTGCSLSSALATVQARTGNWETSLREVKPWLLGALTASAELQVGRGNGPVHHFHHLQRASAPGAFAAALWEAAVPELESIHGLPFIQQLQSGELLERDFTYYLAQDAIYLNGYSRVLARAGALAPTEEEQLFWARSSQQCLEVESELHRTWLSSREAPTALGPVTKSYLDHLLATSASGSYAVVLAAILPCFWLYAEVGRQLHANYLNAGAAADHAYADWLTTYADEDFAAATRKAISLTDAAAVAASDTERAAMMEAFTQSCRYETAFFDAPRLFA
jgi:hydroxymethylpyrimidine/phosphomethylpyrimidine kinase